MNTKIVKIFIVVSLSFILCANSMNLIKPDSEPDSKLINAVRDGDLEAVKGALKEGANVNILTENAFSPNTSLIPPKLTPLICASWFGHLDIAKYLILSKADIDAKGDYLGLKTALTCALEKKHNEIVKLLIDLGANCNSLATAGYHTPINYAIGRVKFYSGDAPNFAMVKLLVWNGVDIDKECGQNHCLTASAKSDNVRLYGIPYAPIMPTELAFFQKHSPILSYRKEGEEMHDFLINYSKKLKNIKNKDLKNIVKEVNKFLVQKTREQSYLPKDLQNMVIDYSLYPENCEEFFNLSEEQIDELLRIYVNEFEKSTKDVDLKQEEENPNSTKHKKMRLK